MNKLNGKPTIVLGNSEEYATILTGLQQLKEIKEEVNKVNKKLAVKYEELIANIQKIIDSWTEAGKNTDKLNDLMNRVVTNKTTLTDEMIEEIQAEIDALQDKIDKFASSYAGANSDNIEQDSYLNMFIKELKEIVKEDE